MKYKVARKMDKMNEIREKKKEYYIKKKILCSQQLNQIYNEIINEKENILLDCNGNLNECKFKQYKLVCKFLGKVFKTWINVFMNEFMIYTNLCEKNMCTKCVDTECGNEKYVCTKCVDTECGKKKYLLIYNALKLRFPLIHLFNKHIRGIKICF